MEQQTISSRQVHSSAYLVISACADDHNNSSTGKYINLALEPDFPL